MVFIFSFFGLVARRLSRAPVRGSKTGGAGVKVGLTGVHLTGSLRARSRPVRWVRSRAARSRTAVPSEPIFVIPRTPLMASMLEFWKTIQQRERLHNRIHLERVMELLTQKIMIKY